jgi:hypothetical protein
MPSVVVRGEEQASEARTAVYCQVRMHSQVRSLVRPVMVAFYIQSFTNDGEAQPE